MGTMAKMEDATEGKLVWWVAPIGQPRAAQVVGDGKTPDTVRIRTSDGKLHTVHALRLRPRERAAASNPGVLVRQPSYVRPCVPPGPELHRQAEAAMRAVPKAGMYKAPKYLAWIKRKPCSWCRAPGPSDAHHYPHQGKGGAHAHDTQTVPLCRGCHDAYHAKRSLGNMNAEQTGEWFRRTQIELLTEYIRAGDTRHR